MLADRMRALPCQATERHTEGGARGQGMGRGITLFSRARAQQHHYLLLTFSPPPSSLSLFQLDSRCMNSAARARVTCSTRCADVPPPPCITFPSYAGAVQPGRREVECKLGLCWPRTHHFRFGYFIAKLSSDVPSLPLVPPPWHNNSSRS